MKIEAESLAEFISSSDSKGGLNFNLSEV